MPGRIACSVPGRLVRTRSGFIDEFSRRPRAYEWKTPGIAGKQKTADVPGIRIATADAASTIPARARHHQRDAAARHRDGCDGPVVGLVMDDRPAGDRADRGAEYDVAEIVLVVVNARHRDVRRNRISRDRFFPAEVALDDGRRGERDGRVARWKRLVVAAVGALAVRGELQRLDEQLGQDLRLKQIHPEMGDLRLVVQAPDRVRPKRERHLYGGAAQILPGR